MSENLTELFRYAGILLHPTSLPGGHGVGDLGQSAYDFVDFLDKAGQSLWQMLPLGPTGFGDSPYQPYSAFAGSPLLISLDQLVKDGLLKEYELEHENFEKYFVEFDKVKAYKERVFRKAFAEFRRDKHGYDKEYEEFLEKEAFWLRDYALFMTLKGVHDGKSWREWDSQYLNPSEEEKEELCREFEEEVTYYYFQQFIFLHQWKALKKYANDKGIKLIGDIPIYVSPDGADVWSEKSLFQMDHSWNPTDVAGVPPDYFSATGQLWGNPLYDWKAHKKDGYSWWIKRMRKQIELTDIVRIDHFRGLEAYWSVPAGSETAIDGKWVKGPGASLLKAFQQEFGQDLPVIAEDLGIITPEVEKLRDKFGLPGMKILQFAFESEDESSYIPYLLPVNCVCYTGTHDNNTSVGWYWAATDKQKDYVRRYMSCGDEGIGWNFIKTAVASVAKYAVYPMQDVLGYGADCRMNTPGVAKGNWSFRCTQEAFNDDLAKALKLMCATYGRDKDRNVKLAKKIKEEELKKSLKADQTEKSQKTSGKKNADKEQKKA